MAFDDSGRIRALNAAAEKLLERTAVDAAGRPVGILFPTLDLSTVGSGSILRLDACRPDGTSFPVRLSLANIALEGPPSFLGRIDRILPDGRVGAAPLADILREEFLMTLSHELRSPLQVILSWAQFLRAGPPGEGLSSRGLEAIERNIRWQVEVIDDVLELAEVVSGSLRLERRAVRWSELIEEAISEIEEDARARRIRVTRSIDPDERPVVADRHWLGRVVRTLLANSLKFTQEGGAIDVDLRPFTGGMQLTIVDDSPQPSEEPYHAQGGFRHGNPTATRLFDGLGVALVKVQRLVELQGGEVQAESVGFGRGARFAVSMPIAKTE